MVFSSGNLKIAAKQPAHKSISFQWLFFIFFFSSNTRRTSNNNKSLIISTTTMTNSIYRVYIKHIYSPHGKWKTINIGLHLNGTQKQVQYIMLLKLTWLNTKHRTLTILNLFFSPTFWFLCVTFSSGRSDSNKMQWSKDQKLRLVYLLHDFCLFHFLSKCFRLGFHIQMIRYF